jgi:Gpi18-like mannosyltransferase
MRRTQLYKLWRAVATSYAGLTAIGLISALLYWYGITRQYPLQPGLAYSHASWPTLVDLSLWAGMRHAVVYGCLIGGYGVALHLVLRITPQQRRFAVVAIVGCWLLYSLVLLGAYPGDSADIFNYVFRGRMQALYGASPLAVTPDAFRNARFYRYLDWVDWVDAYGPLWEYASGAVARAVPLVSRNQLTHYITGYRLLAIALTGVCGTLIVMIVRRRQPEYAAAALLAWLWNPLLLISTAVGAHNDGLMLVLILVAVLLYQRQRWLLGLLALGLAAHVKVTALLLLPVCGLWLVTRRGWWRGIRTSVAALLLIVPVSWLLYAPLGGWATLPRMLHERHILTYNSLANVAFGFLHVHQKWEVTAARQAVIRGATLLFLIIAAALLLWIWRSMKRCDADDATLWSGGIVITMTYLLIGAFWFQSWYVLWVLVLAALLPDSKFTRVLLPLFSLGGLWSNISTDFLNQDRAHRFSGFQVETIMVVVLWTPLLCGLVIPPLWHLVRGRYGGQLPLLAHFRSMFRRLSIRRRTLG